MTLTTVSCPLKKCQAVKTTTTPTGRSIPESDGTPHTLHHNPATTAISSTGGLTAPRKDPKKSALDPPSLVAARQVVIMSPKPVKRMTHGANPSQTATNAQASSTGSGPVPVPETPSTLPRVPASLTTQTLSPPTSPVPATTADRAPTLRHLMPRRLTSKTFSHQSEPASIPIENRSLHLYGPLRRQMPQTIHFTPFGPRHPRRHTRTPFGASHPRTPTRHIPPLRHTVPQSSRNLIPLNTRNLRFAQQPPVDLTPSQSCPALPICTNQLRQHPRLLHLTRNLTLTNPTPPPLLPPRSLGRLVIRLSAPTPTCATDSFGLRGCSNTPPTDGCDLRCRSYNPPPPSHIPPLFAPSHATPLQHQRPLFPFSCNMPSPTIPPPSRPAEYGPQSPPLPGLFVSISSLPSTSPSPAQSPVVSALQPQPLFGKHGSTPLIYTSSHQLTPTSTPPPVSPSTLCSGQANWRSSHVEISTTHPVPCGVHPRKTSHSLTSANLPLTSGSCSHPYMQTDLQPPASSSTPQRTTHSASGPSPKPHFKSVTLGTPYGGVVLLHGHTSGSPLKRSGASDAGNRSGLSHTTSSLGMMSRSAVGGLLHLLRLLHPPPVATLNSRIRGARRTLPNRPLTVSLVIAMIDLIHDRLQHLHPHTSDWSAFRPAVLHYINTNDLVPYDDYYRNPTTSAAATVTTWKPIIPGHSTVPSATITEILNKPTNPVSPQCFPVFSTHTSSVMDACVSNLHSQGIIEPSPQLLPPTMTLFLKPKDERSSRVICDLRPLNGLYRTTPPRFKLPSLPALLTLFSSWPACYFGKLDITAYFHSLALQPSDLLKLTPPHHTTHPFVFIYRGACWVWKRLPFGWCWAPVIAQTHMEHLVTSVISYHTNISTSTYYDDILLAGPCASLLRAHIRNTISRLVDSGLAISPSKCVLEPVTSIDWIGKRLSHRSIHNTGPRVKQLASIIVGLSQCRTKHGLRRILGWSSWFCSHFAGASRSLSVAYWLLNSKAFHSLTWDSLWGFSLSIALGCCHATRATKKPSVVSLFADACASNNAVGICDVSGLNGIALSVPDWFTLNYRQRCDAQQTCELFGVILALSLCIKLNSSAFVYTDNAACYWWFSRFRIPSSPQQAQLLLASSIMRGLTDTDMTVQWISTSENLADRWSRMPLH